MSPEPHTYFLLYSFEGLTKPPDAGDCSARGCLGCHLPLIMRQATAEVLAWAAGACCCRQTCCESAHMSRQTAAGPARCKLSSGRQLLQTHARGRNLQMLQGGHMRGTGRGDWGLPDCLFSGVSRTCSIKGCYMPAENAAGRRHPTAPGRCIMFGDDGCRGLRAAASSMTPTCPA